MPLATARAPVVTLRYFDDCPHWQDARDLLMRAVSDEGLDVEPHLERIETEENARRIGFVGSPSFLIDGRDPFSGIDDTPGLSCRMFQTPEGLAAMPTYEQLREAIRSR